MEAHVRIGRAPAQELMAAVERAGEGDFDGTAAVAERCRGLVASDDEVDTHFARARSSCTGPSGRSERARTELCYGERLRRAGRRIDARVQLRTALETFERLGARRGLSAHAASCARPANESTAATQPPPSSSRHRSSRSR